MSITHKQLKIDGMHCTGCEDIICEAVSALPGVHSVNASYKDALVEVTYDTAILSEATINECLAANGYAVEAAPTGTASHVKRGLVFLALLHTHQPGVGCSLHLMKATL
jgi:copper chaperone CopZ